MSTFVQILSTQDDRNRQIWWVAVVNNEWHLSKVHTIRLHVKWYTTRPNHLWIMDFPTTKAFQDQANITRQCWWASVEFHDRIAKQRRTFSHNTEKVAKNRHKVCFWSTGANEENKVLFTRLQAENPLMHIVNMKELARKNPVLWNQFGPLLRQAWVAAHHLCDHTGSDTVSGPVDINISQRGQNMRHLVR